MSGRPVRYRLLADVERSGGWDPVLRRIAVGETITQIARSFNVSRGFFARVLHDDRERHKLVSRVRGAATEARVEEALAIVDRANLMPNVRQARGKINVGKLHLDALRAAAVAQHWPVTAPPPEAEHAAQPTSQEGRGVSRGAP